MLKSLTIKNFILIKNAEVDFSKQLNIISGETGSGKSILLKAISFLLGEKANKDIIKTGEDFCEVAGTFHIKNKLLKEELIKLDISFTDELIIRRKITKDSNSKIYVNDTNISISKIIELKELLLEISSQNSQHNLNKSTEQLHIIDQFLESKELLLNVKNAFSELKDIQKKLEDFKKKLQFKDERISYIKKQLKEISDMDISEDDDLLEEQIEKILKSQEILTKIKTIESIVFESDESIANSFISFKNLIKSLKIQNEFIKSVDLFDAAFDHSLEEIKKLKKEYNLPSDEAQALIKRSETVRKYINQYGSIKNIIEKQSKLQSELDEIYQIEEDKELLLKKEIKTNELLSTLADELSKERNNIITKLSKKIESEIKELNIPNCIFKIKLDKTNITINGIDSPEFLFSANKGEPLKPMKEIASGGEISRIMLAIHNISISEYNTTILLDEIDSGISGNTGIALGKKIKDLSKKIQVICITHLPQIAIFSDTHIVIDKTSTDNTQSKIKMITETADKEIEIARMLGSELSPKESIEFAKHLIKNIKN